MPAAAIKRVHVEESGEESGIIGGHSGARSRLLEPLICSGSLDKFKRQDVTPVIGSEFEGLQVADLLKWGDDLIRDLAVTSKLAMILS